MPDAQEPKLSGADVRRLLNQMFPPTANADGSPSKENVYVAVVLALLEELEVTQSHMAQMMRGFTVTLNKVAKAVGIDLKALLKNEPAATSESAAAAGPSDKTPFPAGVATTGPAVPAQPEVPAEESGFTQSQPPTNARPNVTPPPANGQPRS